MQKEQKIIERFLLLSIAAAILTIALKTAAAYLTGSVGFLSDALESVVNLVAAAMIIYTAIGHLLDPAPLEQVGIGLFLSIAATLINLGVGLALLKAGKQYRSAALNADGHHLLTDVWTTVGIVAGIGTVAFTGWFWLDPVIALLVGVNILWSGYKLLQQSLSNLISEALPPEDVEVVKAVIADFEAEYGVAIED
uniref:cation diffusion facilitator family transporter n=1 Tax=Corynebacterium stationis TaxID=1705 RepID=UPI00321FDAF8